MRPVLRERGSWRAARPLLGQGTVARRIEARLSTLAAEGGAAPGLGVAFSDENVLGPLIDALRRRPNPRLGSRLGPLVAMAQARPVALFLSIRSFDRVRAGAYATALRYRRLSPLVVQRRARIFGRPPPRWTDVLDRIAQAAPGVPIRVWRKDYARAPEPILSAFLGRALDGVPRLPHPPSTMTPSAEAIAEVERLILAGAHRAETASWPQRVNEVYAERPARPGTPFRPIDPAQTARFAEAYVADVEASRRDRPGCLIEP